MDAAEVGEFAVGILAGAGGGSLIFAVSVPDYLPVDSPSGRQRQIAVYRVACASRRAGGLV